MFTFKVATSDDSTFLDKTLHVFGIDHLHTVGKEEFDWARPETIVHLYESRMTALKEAIQDKENKNLDNLRSVILSDQGEFVELVDALKFTDLFTINKQLF
jgi:hypothetical protein